MRLLFVHRHPMFCNISSYSIFVYLSVWNVYYIWSGCKHKRTPRNRWRTGSSWLRWSPSHVARSYVFTTLVMIWMMRSCASISPGLAPSSALRCVSLSTSCEVTMFHLHRVIPYSKLSRKRVILTRPNFYLADPQSYSSAVLFDTATYLGFAIVSSTLHVVLCHVMAIQCF